LLGAAHDPDNGECFRIRACLRTLEQKVPQRTGMRPLVARKILVHHADSLTA
jgi:hypothetical protein